jgi:FKBP-type peptidyl-prolyl cis-trans isomerase
MARKRDRIVALIAVILFFATSFSISFAVVWQMYQDSHNKGGNNGVEQKQQLQGTRLQNFTPVAHTDKLQIIDEKVGTGTEAKAGDTVTVDYTGAVAATGVIFQSSLDSGQPASLSLSQVIKGWQEGIPGMKVGGQRRLVIPAADAYGANAPQGSGIPANADLVFDITLQSVGQ